MAIVRSVQQQQARQQQQSNLLRRRLRQKRPRVQGKERIVVTTARVMFCRWTPSFLITIDSLAVTVRVLQRNHLQQRRRSHLQRVKMYLTTTTAYLTRISLPIHALMAVPRKTVVRPAISTTAFQIPLEMVYADRVVLTKPASSQLKTIHAAFAKNGKMFRPPPRPPGKE